MKVPSRRTYLKTVGLTGLLGAVGLTSPVASRKSLAAHSDALVDSGHLTAAQAAQRFTETKLTASDTATSGDQFGSAVSVSGDGTTALIGTVRDDEGASVSGAAYVYDLSGRSPTETKLTASDAPATDAYGLDVSVSGDGTTALVGAPYDDGAGRYSDTGSAYVYTAESAQTR
jgi:N-acetylglucosamine kinase-like BadF-type ATPase